MNQRSWRDQRLFLGLLALDRAEAARCMMLRTQGLNTKALAELHLKPLTRMTSETRYPQGDEVPADLFDANASQAALATAEAAHPWFRPVDSALPGWVLDRRNDQ
jgi:hypothetical protein